MAVMGNSDLVWEMPKRLVALLDDQVLTTAWSKVRRGRLFFLFYLILFYSLTSLKAMSAVLLGEWFVPPDVDSAVEVTNNMPSVLVFGSCLGFLLMGAVDAGVTDIQLVEPAPVFARKVRDVLQDNYSRDKVKQLLAGVQVAIHDPVSVTTAQVKGKHDVLMVGLDVNHDIFSSSLVEMVARAKVDFLRPAHRVMPCRVQVFGALIEWDESAASEGVDMRAASTYRWHVVNETVDIHSQNFNVLSEHVCVCDVNLQEAALIRPFDERKAFPITRSGRMMGVITWLVVYLTEDIFVSNSPFIDPVDQSTFRKPIFQHCDARDVVEGHSEELVVHFNLTKLWFEPVVRDTIVRHHLIQPWYFQMLHDQPRNRLYKQAVEAVIARWFAENPTKPTCSVVDVGAGLGLLSVYAAKADSRVRVTAVESVTHLADTSLQIFKDNGVESQVQGV